MIFQEVLSDFELLGIFIRCGHRGISAGKAMGMHLSVDVASVVRRGERHVAIRALRRLGGIIERSRTLAGNAAGLPIVVLIEAAYPTIVVHRHIQVHLVAGGAELRSLISHERLQKNAAMRLGIQIGEQIVDGTHHGVLAGGNLMELRILQIEVSLSHRALHAGDGVAHHAAKSCLRLRRMHNLLDGRIHLARV